MEIILSEGEARVLGCLIEKELATPEYYPLSLNALINACNQKTNRFPVVSLGEGEVMTALHSLRDKQLVGSSEASRVIKYWHGIDKKFNLIRREAALLCLLLLRGPQTTGELRTRSEKLCGFENIEEVVRYLDNLADIGLVMKMPRQPGQKEQRYANLLVGKPSLSASAAEATRASIDSINEAVSNDDRLSELEKVVATLQQDLAQLRLELFGDINK